MPCKKSVLCWRGTRSSIRRFASQDGLAVQVLLPVVASLHALAWWDRPVEWAGTRLKDLVIETSWPCQCRLRDKRWERTVGRNSVVR